MIDKRHPYFAQNCYNHSMRFGNQVIDKIVISYKTDFVLPRQRKKPNSPGCLDEIQYGDNLQLHIAGENINPKLPMIYAVHWAFSILINSRYFTKHIYEALKEFFNIGITADLIMEFFVTLVRLGFTFGQLELAFDFPLDSSEGIFIEPENSRYNTAYYSLDYTVKRRKEKNDQFYAPKVDKTDSILCVYDRGLSLRKDGHVLNCGRGIYRLEFRIKQSRKRLLEMQDLICNMDRFIQNKGARIKNIVSNYIEEGDLYIEFRYLEKNLPLLIPLLPVWIWEDDF